MNFQEFIKDWRVILLIVLIIGSIGIISHNGISQGIDLRGGSTIQIHLVEPVDVSNMSIVTAVLDKRLNAFGVNDVSVRSSGDQDVIVQIAGVKPEQVQNLIGTPGKFEAKINNQTVLVGSSITSVKPYTVAGKSWEVPFVVTTDAAKNFAQMAKGKAGTHVDVYLDGKLLSSPEISPEIATGTPSTEVKITGTNQTKEAAQDEAKSTQVVLQSGALPVSVSIAGVKSLSAELGSQFKDGALIAGVLALIFIALIIFIRYRNPILVIPIIITSLAELVLILGVASIIHWTIDLPAIAGILAAIGTGVDDQIIITDEVLKEGVVAKKTTTTLKFKINNAFFIIFASAATLIASMLPLAYVGITRGVTGIGVLSGFAFTTIIGVLVGIFLTRPVYAKFIELLLGKDKREEKKSIQNETSVNTSRKGKKRKNKKGRR